MSIENRKYKKGLSSTLNTILILVLTIVSVGILASYFFGVLRSNTPSQAVMIAGVADYPSSDGYTLVVTIKDTGTQPLQSVNILVSYTNSNGQQQQASATYPSSSGQSSPSSPQTIAPGTTQTIQVDLPGAYSGETVTIVVTATTISGGTSTISQQYTIT